MAAPSRHRNPDRVFLKHTYTTNLGAAQAHVRYVAFRSREAPTDTRGIFDRDRDHGQVGTFNERLKDRLTAHPKAATLHKLVVSFRQDQWDRSGWASWKPVVREALVNYEQATGKRLDWIAAEHMAKGHPHVHIGIKATCTDAAGTQHRLRLQMRDVKLLRDEFQRIYERDRYLHRSVDQELRREEQQQESRLMGRVAGDLLRKLARAAEREHRHQEMERQRQRERGR